MKKIALYLILVVVAFSSCQKDTPPPPEKSYDLAYGTDPLQKMDVYLPPTAAPETPFVIWIHGGSWTGGDKENERSLQETAFAQNIPTANINYRLTQEENPDITYKEIFADVDAAIDYIVDHRDEWNIENTKIVIAGASAGAHLAMHRGYNSNENIVGIASMVGPTYLDYEPLLAYYGLSEFAKGIITRLAGADYNVEKDSIPQVYYDISPIHFIKPNIPIRMYYGDIDIVVPLYQATTMRDSLEAKGADHKLTVLKNAGHTLGTQEQRDEITKDFLDFVKSL